MASASFSSAVPRNLPSGANYGSRQQIRKRSREVSSETSSTFWNLELQGIPSLSRGKNSSESLIRPPMSALKEVLSLVKESDQPPPSPILVPLTAGHRSDSDLSTRCPVPVNSYGKFLPKFLGRFAQLSGAHTLPKYDPARQDENSLHKNNSKDREIVSGSSPSVSDSNLVASTPYPTRPTRQPVELLDNILPGSLPATDPSRSKLHSFKSYQPRTSPRTDSSSSDLFQSLVGPGNASVKPGSSTRPVASTNFTSKFPIVSSNNIATINSVPGFSDRSDLIVRVERWTKFKWVVSISVLILLGSSLGGIFCSLSLWLNGLPGSEINKIINWDIVLYTTVASGSVFITSIVGLTGVLLNSRTMLALYNILLWPCLMSITTIGYTSYKRSAFNLSGKINQGWSQVWGDDGRLTIQNSLACCGLYNPTHASYLSPRCHIRALLPGCKDELVRSQSHVLSTVTWVSFSAVGLTLLSVLIAVVCSNHVNNLFGKGLMPSKYRLSLRQVKESARVVQRAGRSTTRSWKSRQQH